MLDTVVVGGGGGGGGGWRNWVSIPKSFKGLAFQPFPNFDQPAQINRKTSSTEKVNEESCLKQPEEATIQELH